MRRLRGKEDPLNALVAGGLAGTSIFLETPSQRRYQVSLYIFARALAMVWTGMGKRGMVPKVEYGEVWLFCFLCAFVQYCFAYEPDVMRRSYYHFIDNLARDERMHKFFYYLRNYYRVKVVNGWFNTDDLAAKFKLSRLKLETEERRAQQDHSQTM